jgi:hypothetical protein
VTGKTSAKQQGVRFAPPLTPSPRRGAGLPALGQIERPLRALARQIFQEVAERVGVPAFDVGPQAPSRVAPIRG